MYKKFLRFFNSLLFLYSLILLVSYFVHGNLLFEWVVSFMPYFVVINAFILLSLLWRKIFSFSILFLGLVTLLMLVRVFDFAFIKPPLGTGEKAVTVLFFNKLLYNKDFANINKAVSQVQADIVGIAELDVGEQEKISVLNTYPHRLNIDTPDQSTLALFSKYPITKEFTSMKYLLATKVNIGGKEVKVFMFHPTAPVDLDYITRRDTEIKKLGTHLQSMRSENTIVMGDFNLTPWSPLYIDAFSSNSYLKNVSKGYGLKTTYHVGPLRVTIDHIFVSKKFKVESFTDNYVNGSDHNLIWTIIKI